MTSYTNFCFFKHLRISAFIGSGGSIRDGISETCWFYSQNLPTVALLLPRAGLCLALLFAFANPNVEYLSLVDSGNNHRDGTFFRVEDGSLTDYARGVLIANAAWTAWRLLVLLTSWYAPFLFQCSTVRLRRYTGLAYGSRAVRLVPVFVVHDTAGRKTKRRKELRSTVKMPRKQTLSRGTGGKVPKRAFKKRTISATPFGPLRDGGRARRIWPGTSSRLSISRLDLMGWNRLWRLWASHLNHYRLAVES